MANAGIGALSEFLGLSEGNPLSVIGTRAVSIVLVFVLDAAAIAVLFRTLSGVKASWRTLIPGRLLRRSVLTVGWVHIQSPQKP